MADYTLLVRIPLRLVGPEPYELTLALPEGERVHMPHTPDGYAPNEYDADQDRAALMALHQRCGFAFDVVAFEQALALCIPGGVKIVRHTASGEIVSTMMARHLASNEFPFGGRIDWLATDVAHRGRGLGRLAAALATRHLIERGYKKIWVTTQPHRTDAIRVFTSLGFRPTERTRNKYDWPTLERAVQKGASR